MKVYYEKYPNHTRCSFWKEEFSDDMIDFYIKPSLGSFVCQECSQNIKLDTEKQYVICKQYNRDSRKNKLKRLINENTRKI